MSFVTSKLQTFNSFQIGKILHQKGLLLVLQYGTISLSKHKNWKQYWTYTCDFTNKSLKLDGFNLKRPEWRILNRFRCGHGCRKQQMHRCNFTDSLYCDNVTIHTMNYILSDCHLRRLPGSLGDLNLVTEEPIELLKNLRLIIITATIWLSLIGLH